MPLHGLKRLSVRPKGGIAKVEIVPACCFAGAGFDPGTGSLACVETTDGFAGYAFREDRAHYSESLSAALVKHTLDMEFAAGEEARRAVDELVRRSGEGFVAVVTTAGGERIVVGWSARFGTGYPLRVTNISSVSGSVPEDVPSVKVTLESEDADPSSTVQ